MRARFGLIVVLAALAAPLLGATAKPRADLADSRLFVPWADAKTLLEKLKPPDAPPPETPPPEPYAVTSARYEGRLEGETAVFDVTLRFTILSKDQWMEVPLLSAGLALEDPKLDDGPALLNDRDGWHRVVVKGAGAHVFTARFYTATGNQLGPHSTGFPAASAPVSTLAFTVPEPGLDLKADPATMNRTTNPDAASRLEAVILPGNEVKVSWSRKVEADEAALRVNAQVESLVSLGERLCQVSSLVRYEILHRGVTGLKLKLPAEVTVTDVSGPGLADWQVSKSGDGQEVSVALGFEARENYALTVTYELALPDMNTELSVPALTVAGADRETGNIAVAARTNIELDVTGSDNLISIDPTELADSLRNRSADPVLYAYTYTGHPWSLGLKTTRHQDTAGLAVTTDVLSLNSFLSPGGKLVTTAEFLVRNRSGQFLRVALPARARLLSAAHGDEPIRPSRDQQGKYLLPLDKPSAGQEAAAFTLKLTYLEDLGKLDDGSGRLNLEAPTADVLVNRMQWVFTVPEDYAFEEVEGKSTMDLGRGHIADSDLLHWDWAPPGILGNAEAAPEETKKRKVQSKAPAPTVSREDRKNLNAVFTGEVAYHGQNRPSGYQASELSLSAQKPAAASLPVLFTAPDQGRRIFFTKSIVVENEPNQVALKYHKLRAMAVGLKVALIVAALIVLAVLVTYFIARKVKLLPGPGISGGAS